MTERVEPGALGPVMRQASFSGRREGARMFADTVVTMLRTGEDYRVLDVGSGIGDVSAMIHTARPSAHVTGIDFSPANVVTARARTDTAGLTFVCGDYLTWSGGSFDLIVADSVLHLIEAPVPRLAAKLVADLAMDGLVVATVPDAVALNHILLFLRRLWRLTPLAADRLAFSLALRLYPDLPPQILADRMPYLRLLPRLFDAAAMRAFAAAGLVLERNDFWPSPSAAKPRHRLMIWRRVKPSGSP
jgi:SAM-dependent methyltransferase